MNEDIKILREALANMASFVERKDAHLIVPLQLDSSTRAQYREACDPDRIRRLLDDAERWKAFTEAVGMHKSSFTIRWHGELMSMEGLKNYCDGWRGE